MLRLHFGEVLGGLVFWVRHGRVSFFGLMMFFATGCMTFGSRDGVIYQVRVENGDTLANLSKRFDSNWQSVARMNGLSGKNPLRVGQVLRVAAGAGASDLKIGHVDMPISRRSQGNVSAKSRGPADDDSRYEQPGTPEAGDERSWQEEDLNAPRKTPGAVDSDTDDDRASDSRGGRGSKARGGMMGEPAQNFVVSWPAPGDVSSNYGPRWGRFHNGIDIRASRGAQIRAAADGRVIFVGRLNGYGKTVIVDHGQYRSLYGHCGKIVAKQGAWVKSGTHIAHVGISGNSRGAHLHFELRTRRDQPVDPIPFMEAKLLSSVTHKKSRKKAVVRTAATH